MDLKVKTNQSTSEYRSNQEQSSSLTACAGELESTVDFA